MHPNTVAEPPLTALWTNTLQLEAFAVKVLEYVTLRKNVPDIAPHVHTIHSLNLVQFAETAKGLGMLQNPALVIHLFVLTTSGELVKYATKNHRVIKNR